MHDVPGKRTWHSRGQRFDPADLPAPVHAKRAARRPPNRNIISHLFSPVYPQFLQLFAVILMEHPILKNPIPGCIMKIQKRSESNVLSKLTPINTVES